MIINKCQKLKLMGNCPSNWSGWRHLNNSTDQTYYKKVNYYIPPNMRAQWIWCTTYGSGGEPMACVPQWARSALCRHMSQVASGNRQSFLSELKPQHSGFNCSPGTLWYKWVSGCSLRTLSLKVLPPLAYGVSLAKTLEGSGYTSAEGCLPTIHKGLGSLQKRKEIHIHKPTVLESNQSSRCNYQDKESKRQNKKLSDIIRKQSNPE